MKYSIETLVPSSAAAGAAQLNAGWPGLLTFPDGQEDQAASKSYDDILVEQTLAGDYEAFEQLITRHRRRVFGIAHKFFRNPETAEDMAQETFAKAYFSLASYRRGASFEHWLARIAVNNCYDELRRRHRRGESCLADVTDDQAAWLEHKMAGVSFALHHGERRQDSAAEIAEKLLSQLRPEERLTLVLLHAEGYSVREVAEFMGWSEAKVKIRAFRARHAMRRSLERLTKQEKRKTAGRESRRQAAINTVTG
jgi:RNA polymerase sigma-70 factor, ECF subfamily